MRIRANGSKLVRTAWLLLACSLGLAFPAQAQPTAEGSVQFGAVERIAHVLSGDAAPDTVSDLFREGAKLVVDREIDLSFASLRNALDARECGSFAYAGSRDAAAEMIVAESAEGLEALPALTESVLIVRCAGTRPAEWEIYGVDFLENRIERMRFVATVPVPRAIITTAHDGSPRPALPPYETLSTDFVALAGYFRALYVGDLERALTYLAEDVTVAVSDGTRVVGEFPSGKEPARAMHLAMTNRGGLGVDNFSCRPEGERALCDVIFGRGNVSRHFTLRFSASGGPITQILSWENHDRPD